MDSNNQDDSRRKHRRSSDEESTEVSPKRRKHSHRHRHHRSKRHRSKKHEDEPKSNDAVPSPAVAAFASGYDDMEEGEIIEEYEVGGEFLNVKAESDVESGEIKPAEAKEYSNMENDSPNRDLGVEERVEKYDNDLKTVREKLNNDEYPKLSEEWGVEMNRGHHARKKTHKENYGNGDIADKSSKDDDRRHKLRRSPLKGRDLEKSHLDRETMGIREGVRDERKSLSSGRSTGDKYKTSVRSPSRDRHYDEAYARNRSRSHDRPRERSRSHSILQEVSLMKTTHKTNDLDDERRIVGDSRDIQRGSRDLVRDKEREHINSYGGYGGRGSRETPDGYRGGRDLDRERGLRREHVRVWSRDRYVDGDRKTGMERDRSVEKETEYDRTRALEREKDRDRDRERERGRERARDSRYRDWNRDREIERDRKVRGDSRDKEIETDRKDRDSNRERIRDSWSHRLRNYGKYDSYHDQQRDYDSRSRRYDERDYYRDRSRKNDLEKVHGTKNETSEASKDKLEKDEAEQEEYQEKVVLQLEEQEEEDLNRIEESRRRRQAILEKYKNQKLQQQEEPHFEEAGKDEEPVEKHNLSTDAVNAVPEVRHGSRDGGYVDVAEPSFSVGKSPPQNGLHAFVESHRPKGLGEGTPKDERSDDMFCDDIFGDSPAGVRKSGKGDGLPIERSGLHDNWDDAEGYYSYRIGEVLDGRYEVTAAHGKGVYSTVVRAKDLKAGNGDPEEVAIKIIRNNDTMYKAGLEELVILKKLVGADPEDKRHCVRLISSFKYRNHLCLVIESLHMNLREVLKKFGRNIGLKLTAVRTYAKQLFIALKHLRNCGVLHCDIKPDNMLVNEAKNVLKLCDFGNAMLAGKNEITPYLVSRFYRAPEIILGLAYDHPLDIWSVGCCLYELYTGKVLFPGPSNNDMLRLHMELKGPFPKKMLRKGAFIDQHFDQDLNFHATEEDPVTKKTIKRLILNVKPRDIGTLITSSPGEDPKMLANFKDLLEKVFVLDPEKRMTVSQALSHPFITGK